MLKSAFHSAFSSIQLSPGYDQYWEQLLFLLLQPSVWKTDLSAALTFYQYCSPSAEMKTSYSFIPFTTCCYSHPTWRGYDIWNMIYTVQYYRSIERNNCIYPFNYNGVNVSNNSNKIGGIHPRCDLCPLNSTIHTFTDSFSLHWGQVGINNSPTTMFFGGEQKLDETYVQG